MTLTIQKMSLEEFRIWVLPIIEGTLFPSRDRLVRLLADTADRAAIETEFREYFEGYCGLAFSLEKHEAALLSELKTCDTFAPLQHRVAVVESKRKTSELGRELRRMGVRLYADPKPPLKIADLTDADFRQVMLTFVNAPIFDARAKVVKLLADSTPHPQLSLLKAAFLRFFICYLELEQLLEDYDYDNDAGLELRPELQKEIDRSIADVADGTTKTIPIEDIAKQLGLQW